MKELIKTNEVKVTSRDIAEWTGKRHDNVVRDIENELQTLANAETSNLSSLFQESSYQVDGQMKRYKQFAVTKEGVMQLALKYDAVSRYKCIQKLKELESQSKDSYMIDDSIKRAERWIEEEKERIALRTENKELIGAIETNKPYVEACKNLIDSEGLMLLRDVAKHLEDCGQNRLAEFLLNKKWIFKNKQSKLEAYQSFVNKGYFVNKQKYIEDKDIYVTRLYITKKGLASIERLWRKSQPQKSIFDFLPW